jgi:hypothetical protein
MKDIRQTIPKKPSKSNIIDLLIGYRTTISVLSLIALAYALFFADLDLPQWMYVFILGITLGSVPAYGIGRKIVDWLYSPPTIHIIELDMKQSDYGFSIWRLPISVFKKVSSVGGPDVDLEPVRTFKGTAYFVEWFDPVELEAKGIWSGSASNREMMLSRSLISEIRDELEGEAQKSFQLRTKISSIVRISFRKIMYEFLSASEKEQVFKGENISKVIDEVMNEADVNDGASEFQELGEELKLDETPEQNEVNTLGEQEQSEQ